MITFAIKTALKTDKAESYLCSILVTAPFSEEAILLQENHSSDLRKLVSLNTVEINPAGDSITTLIGPVSDYKLLSCTLKLIYQGLYPLASDIVDHKLHLRIGGEWIRDGSLGIKGIGTVLLQETGYGRLVDSRSGLNIPTRTTTDNTALLLKDTFI